MLFRSRGYQTHPSVSREAIRYSRGQLIHADFLFMRDADFFAGPEHRMRGAFLAMAQGFFDHAERLLSTREVSAILENEAGPEDLTGALDAASRLMANHIWRARAKDMPRHVVRLFRDGVNLMKPRHRFEGF